jgi:hypothetical protein
VRGLLEELKRHRGIHVSGAYLVGLSLTLRVVEVPTPIHEALPWFDDYVAGPR